MNYTDKEIEQWRDDSIELQSLRMSIIQSPLADYFPKRVMPFHGKVVTAIFQMNMKIDAIDLGDAIKKRTV